MDPYPPKQILFTSEFQPDSGERRTLFDQGGYQVISAVFKGDLRKRRLAQRCEGNPTVGNCPTGWHIVPEFLEIPLLCALLDELWKNPREMTNANRRQLVLDEIKLFYQQKVAKNP